MISQAPLDSCQPNQKGQGNTQSNQNSHGCQIHTTHTNLELDPSYREREPILSHVTAAFVEDWWRANQRVAQELIGDYYYDDMRDRLLASIENEQPNVRLNAYEILRQYGEQDLASQDLSQYHLFNLTDLFELWEIGNPTQHLDRAVDYFGGLEDTVRVQQAIGALEAVRRTNPEGNSPAMRYVDAAIERLRRSPSASRRLQSNGSFHRARAIRAPI